MTAAALMAGFPSMTRTLTLESDDGLTTAAVQGVLRPLRSEERVGSAEAMNLEFTASQAALATAGFDPLRKFTRIVDGNRRYTIDSQPTVTHPGTGPAIVKALVRG